MVRHFPKLVICQDHAHCAQIGILKVYVGRRLMMEFDCIFSVMLVIKWCWVFPLICQSVLARTCILTIVGPRGGYCNPVFCFVLFCSVFFLILLFSRKTKNRKCLHLIISHPLHPLFTKMNQNFLGGRMGRGPKSSGVVWCWWNPMKFKSTIL